MRRASGTLQKRGSRNEDSIVALIEERRQAAGRFARNNKRKRSADVKALLEADTAQHVHEVITADGAWSGRHAREAAFQVQKRFRRLLESVAEGTTDATALDLETLEALESMAQSDVVARRRYDLGRRKWDEISAPRAAPQ